LDCVIRGLSPSPGAWFEAKGERIKVLLAGTGPGRGSPGDVLFDFAIACGEGALRPLLVQRAGRAPADWLSFLRGFALKPGERVG
jgi:methionyl-tRNA formyltransferase